MPDNKKATFEWPLFCLRSAAGQLIVAGKFVGWQWAAEQVALQPIATGLYQPGLLLGVSTPSAVILIPSSWPKPMTERTMAVVAWLVASPWVKLRSSLRVATCSLGR